MAQNITDRFNQFAGREVAVLEFPKLPADRRLKEDGSYAVGVSLDLGNEPTLKAMIKLAAENKVDLLMNFRGAVTRIACNKAPEAAVDLVRFDIQQAPDGKYRIGSKFTVA